MKLGLGDLGNLKASLEKEEKQAGTYTKPEPPLVKKPQQMGNPSYRRNNHRPEKGSENRNKGNLPLKQACAPYNFVPLPETVVPAEGEEQGSYFGVISYEIIAKTPLFIRGKDSEFFAPGGRRKIPGSSLRGMIKNLVKIMAYGSMRPGEDVQDSTLYYRSFTDVCIPYRDYYLNNIRTEIVKDGKKISQVHANAGYLVQEEENYWIVPAQLRDGKGYKRERIGLAAGVKPPAGPRWRTEDVVMVSGFIGNKKWNNCLYPPDFRGQRIKLSDRDVEGYRDDAQRKGGNGFDLFAYLENAAEQQKIKEGKYNYLSGLKGSIVPCFYVLWTDDQGRERVSFGNTTYFRLAYRQSVGEHIPAALSGEHPDIADRLFGEKGKWASRVFFEDAQMEDSSLSSLLPVYLKPLLSPKPTTFQHYLEQPQAKVINDLQHWDNGTRLRGYKLYWHRCLKPAEWTLADNVKALPGVKKVALLPTGSLFRGSIRFEKLSQVELGALLFALQLPPDCAHKLGMGKPLGLGSVRIHATLQVGNSQQRYTQLFAGKQWASGLEKADIAVFQSAFSRYVSSHLSLEKAVENLWEVARMHELRCLLNWEQAKAADWKDKTRYLEIERREPGKDKENEYKERPVLPRPSQIAKLPN